MRARAAVVIGVSSLPGIGHSVAKKFAQEEGMKVGIVGRRADRLERAKADIEREAGAGAACVYRVCDAGRREELHEALSSMMKGELAGCELSCLVFNASARPFPLASVMDLDADRLEGDHRTSASGFVAAAQWAVPQMRANDVGPAEEDATRGTIILTGATASLRGSAKFGSFCASKAAARSLCMSLAREVLGDGVHVAHVVVDGMVAMERDGGETPSGGRFMSPDAIADSYVHLYRQPRSCMSFEIDMRPHESQW